MITGLYASLLTLWFVLLSMRVIALRGNPLFAFLKLGASPDAMLERAVRAHGNFAEYVPIMLILVYLLETLPDVMVNPMTLHMLGGAFLIGRLMHGVCFGFLQSNMALRVGGTALTLFPLIAAALLLLVNVL
jgi:uncharacterized membrane protein YecN with MAPEG domain